MNEPYKNQSEPKVGDIVRFASENDGATYKVVSTLGGRMGNKVGVVPVNNPKTFSREYYYYCLVPVSRA